MKTNHLKEKTKFFIKKRLSTYTFIKNRLRYNQVAHPDKTLYLNTNEINLWLKRNSKLRRITILGEIIDGDWDINAKTKDIFFEENLKYKGIVEHFVEKLPWEETVLFKIKYAEQLKINGKVYGCKSLKDLAVFYKHKAEPLYESIKRHGLVPQYNKHVSPILLNIGRRGDFIFTTDGDHRFFIATILGIEIIPVKIWCRHVLWQQTREKLPDLVTNLKGSSNKLIDHPDLQDIINNIQHKQT